MSIIDNRELIKLTLKYLRTNKIFLFPANDTLCASDKGIYF